LLHVSTLHQVVEYSTTFLVGEPYAGSYTQPVSVTSAGAAFKKALVEESPLQIIGTINANHALLAKRAGFRAIYLSGGGVAAGSLGIPDLGITTLEDVLIDVRRITNVCDTPLLVDADTGFGPSAFNIARTVKDLIKAGAAAMHIVRRDGSQAGVIDTMQTREELYQAINYYEYEKALDQTLGKDNG
jgi:2-methylisocitrate lyase-like PEP mutase family enzyme